MTTQQNAPVLAKHRDEAAKAAGFPNYSCVPNGAIMSVLAHAQALANLEAANNRLAEIKEIVAAESHPAGPNGRLGAIGALASGHTPSKTPFDGFQMIRDHVLGTPSPCPGCAAKDEAMAAFKAEVSQTCADTRFMVETHCDTEALALVSNRLNRFIIPPADPVAEAASKLFDTVKYIGAPSDVDVARARFTENFREIALELSRLPRGGAK